MEVATTATRLTSPLRPGGGCESRLRGTAAQRSRKPNDIHAHRQVAGQVASVGPCPSRAAADPGPLHEVAPGGRRSRSRNRYGGHPRASAQVSSESARARLRPGQYAGLDWRGMYESDDELACLQRLIEESMAQ